MKILFSLPNTLFLILLLSPSSKSSKLSEENPTFDPEEIIVVVCILVAIIVFISLLACFLNRREEEPSETEVTDSKQESLANFKNTDRYKEIKEKALKEKLYYMDKSKIILDESNVKKKKEDKKDENWIEDFGGEKSEKNALTIDISQELDDDVRKNVRGKGRIRNREPGFVYDYKRDSKVGKMLRNDNQEYFKNFTLMEGKNSEKNGGFESPGFGDDGFIRSVVVSDKDSDKNILVQDFESLRYNKG